MPAWIRLFTMRALARLRLAPLSELEAARGAVTRLSGQAAAADDARRELREAVRTARAARDSAGATLTRQRAEHDAERAAARLKADARRGQVAGLRQEVARLRASVVRLRAAAGPPDREVAAMLPLRIPIARAGAALSGRGLADETAVARAPAYAMERAAWSRGERPPAMRQVSTAGLVFSLPADAGADGSLSDRLARGWLPFGDLARVRQVVVGGVMLDIGANVGTTCLPRVAFGDFAFAYAAEPEGGNYRCLVGNVLDNNLAGRVLPDRVAISSVSGSARLRRGTQIGTHRLLAADQATADHGVEEVPALTLDDWLARIEAPVEAISFVKVDTQGWDGHVLAGGRGLLQRRGIVWQIEVSPSMMQTSGHGVGDVTALIGTHFTQVKDLGSHSDGRLRPASDLPDILAALDDRRFTNLLLLNTL